MEIWRVFYWQPDTFGIESYRCIVIPEIEKGFRLNRERPEIIDWPPEKDGKVPEPVKIKSIECSATKQGKLKNYLKQEEIVIKIIEHYLA